MPISEIDTEASSGVSRPFNCVDINHDNCGVDSSGVLTCYSTCEVVYLLEDEADLCWCNFFLKR